MPGKVWNTSYNAILVSASLVTVTKAAFVSWYITCFQFVYLLFGCFNPSAMTSVIIIVLSITCTSAILSLYTTRHFFLYTPMPPCKNAAIRFSTNSFLFCCDVCGLFHRHRNHSFSPEFSLPFLFIMGRLAVLHNESFHYGHYGTKALPNPKDAKEDIPKWAQHSDVNSETRICLNPSFSIPGYSFLATPWE